MEPALIGTAARVASGPIARQLGKRTLRLRVSWAVARQARGWGIEVTAGALRAWLARADVQELLKLGTPEAVDTAASHLARVLPGDGNGTSHDAQKVVSLLLTEYLRRQDPSAAVAASYAWQREHTREAGRSTREEVRTAGASILNRLSASEEFSDQARTLHPWHRDQAVALRGAWPDMELVVNAIASTDDRKALLEQWAGNPPDWFAASPAEVACWLGDLAAGSGNATAAAQFYAAGLERGAFPAGYWQARRAMQLFRKDPSAAEDILKSVGDGHPLARGLRHWHHESWQEAIDALSTWDPASDADLALKLQLLARLRVGSGNLNAGIALALEAAELEDATGAGILAAELLLTRARFGKTTHRLADSEQALTLALRARNARRSWHGDSTAAALVAMKSAALAGDHGRALALAHPPPAGDATETEAADPRLRHEAALLAALAGRFEEAREAAGSAELRFAKDAITALEFASRGETSEAANAWGRALSVAADEADILVAAMHLAELGAPLPDLEELEHSHEETVREIRTVHQAMTSGGGRLEALRAGAAKSPILTIKLAEWHTGRDEPRMAAEVLNAGAERWDDPRLMLMAARQYRGAGNSEEARRHAESALTLGGPRWAGAFDAHALLFEMHNASGEWDRATDQARALVSLDRHDPDARWALVHSLTRRGDLEGAWAALTPDGDPVEPRDRHDALVWIGLAARCDTSPQFVHRALTTMRRWPEDEQLRGEFLGNLYTGLRRAELTPTEEDLAALHAATADYTEQFPDNQVFREVSIPRDDPLAALAPTLRERHEALAAVFAQVEGGQLPLGLLADATGSSYAEATLQRAAGFVRAHDPGRDGQEAVQATLDHPVVLDTTAAHTLTLLDADTKSHLLAVFGQILTTDPAYHDALRGHEALAMRSTMSAGWDPAAQRPTLTRIDESTAADLADRAELLCEVLQSAVRRPWQEMLRLGDLASDSGWLTPLDMAASRELPYWCDDLVLRSLASSLGVQTFGTVDLLRCLSSAGRLEQDLLTVTEATLYRHFYADLGFDHEALAFAAQMDEWRPRGAAFAITRPAAWANPSEVCLSECNGGREIHTASWGGQSVGLSRRFRW